MRILYALIFTLGVGSVWGQVQGDTLGLTGTMADTVVGNRLFEEMKELMKERKWEEAEVKGEQAEFIYLQTIGERSIQIANIWNQIGFIEYYKRVFNKAASSWEKALELYLMLLGAENREVASLYNNLGAAYIEKNNYGKAFECFQKALNIDIKIIGEEHVDIAGYYNNIGYSLNLRDGYDEAIDYLQRAITIYSKILEEEDLEMADSYDNLGISFENKGDYENAYKYKQKALEIRLKILGEEHEDVASSYNNIGVFYEELGDYEKSLHYKEKALTIRQKIFDEEHTAIADAYNSISHTYASMGNSGKAIECLQKALKIRLKNSGEVHTSVANSYDYLGRSYMSEGNFDKAIEYVQKSLSIRLKILGQEHRYVGASYNNLGSLYESKGNYDKAIEYKYKALEIFLRNLGENHQDVAKVYNNLGNSYDSKGDNKKAIEYFQKAEDAYLKILGEEHPNIATVYNNLGVSYTSMGIYEDARKYLNSALEIRLKVLESTHPDLIQPYVNLGDLFKLKGEYPKALEYYRQALYLCAYEKEGIEIVKSVEFLLKVLQALSETLMLQFELSHSPEQLSQSFEYICKALAALNYQQSTLTEEASKSFWQSQNHPIYEQAISVSLLKADVDKNDTLRQNTFTYAEKSKSALLQAQIKSADALAFAGIPDSLLKQEHKLRIDITWREKQRQGLLDKGLAETDTTVLRIGGIVFDLKQEYETLKKRFETEYPEYYRLKYDLSTVSLPYVQDTLLQKDQALLEYFVGDSAIFVFVVRPDTFAVLEIPNDFGLDSLVNQLRQGIYGYYEANKLPALYAPTAQQYTEAATILYNKLISPVQSLLHKRLIIVPDGVLGYVPFEALLLRADDRPERFHLHHYFGQEHIISYAYSATLLREMRAKKHRKEPQGKVLAMAPFFRGDVRKLSESIASGEALLALRSDTLSALPDSGEEALRIAKAYKGKSLIGKEATKAAFEREASDYRILHLSTHGVADDRVGDYAWLGFAKPGAQDQFEKLYVRDIYNLSLNADLVVLSACQAGIGKLQRGEGIISLSRAFAYAGAKGIVTTLWSVEDKKTKDFMLAFYGHLRKMPAAEALWQTRRDFLTKRTGEAAHPYFWAGFIGVGDM